MDLVVTSLPFWNIPTAMGKLFLAERNQFFGGLISCLWGVLMKLQQSPERDNTILFCSLFWSSTYFWNLYTLAKLHLISGTKFSSPSWRSSTYAVKTLMWEILMSAVNFFGTTKINKNNALKVHFHAHVLALGVLEGSPWCSLLICVV